MELLQLKYFCDAAKTENFSKTAQKYGVPPSCVSQSIKRLEKELSVKLFTRTANKIELNDRGIEFYEKVSEGLGIIDNAASAVADDGKKGNLDICINTNRRIVMQTIEKFKAIYPHVNITSKYLTYDLSGNFDIIIDGETDVFSSYNKRMLLSEEINVAISKNNPLATADFNFPSLANQPFISTNKLSRLYNMTKSICNDFGFDPNVAVISDDPYYIRKYVELDLAVTIAPAFSWYGQFGDGVALFPLNGYTRDTFIYTNSKKYLPLCAKNFINFLIDECEEEYKRMESTN